MPNWMDYAGGRQKKADQKAYSDISGEADLYRAALEKTAYGNAGSQYGQGLDQISNYLAGAGPLADSGAGRALRTKLYSQIYGQARGQIGQGYAAYLAQLLASQRNFRNQKALMKLQRGSTLQQIGGGLAGVGASLIPGAGIFKGGGGGGSVFGPPPSEVYW